MVSIWFTHIVFILILVRMKSMHHRALKSLLYEQVARMGKALSSPKRLEILEMLAQGEKAVETIVAEIGIDVKLASAHLKALRAANLVEVRRDGKRMIYRLSGADVAQLGVMLRQVAEEHLLELRMALREMVSAPDLLTQVSRKDLLAKARRGDVVMLDVRPHAEYDAAHLPHARSMPLAELARRLSELPRDVEIVAYCRGPFCVMSDAAVALLRTHGFRARKTLDGVSEWLAAGLPVSTP
jgi:rhodanese-related sulfurtransferase/DNA-binding transcriptional ArsR family regulator